MTLEQPIAQGETILVVEDDKNIRRVVAGFLSGLGYTVLEAGDGKTALALLEGAPEIELLLSDVVLPGGLSGPDIVAAARCQRADLKSLFMSGHIAKGTSNPVRLPEDIGLLRKPFTKHDLALILRAVLDELSERFCSSSANAVKALAVQGVSSEPVSPEFPVKQGKNREFSQISPRIADSYGLSG